MRLTHFGERSRGLPVTETAMLPLVLAALIVNVVVTAILPVVMLSPLRDVSPVYGPDGPARRILACLYGAICTVSLWALVSWPLLGSPATTMAVASVLFPLQIVYKLVTLPAVGWQNPVVKANLAIVVLLAAALVSIHRTAGV